MEAHMYRAAVAEGRKESEQEAKKQIQVYTVFIFHVVFDIFL